MLYFTHLPRSPQWIDFYQIWYRRSPRGCNQLCRIFCRSVQGYWFCGGLKFAYPHRNWRSPLTLSELPFRLWFNIATIRHFRFVGGSCGTAHEGLFLGLSHVKKSSWYRPRHSCVEVCLTFCHSCLKVLFMGPKFPFWGLTTTIIYHRNIVQNPKGTSLLGMKRFELSLFQIRRAV